ncbi:hypothetical protein [Luteimonas marina]|nr:hypothetical protein [Luteimonas marina]
MQIDLPVAISIGALFVSLVSLYFTRRFWLQSNRPIVTAFVDEHSELRTASTFNLIISNSGNRPAVNIRLHADADRVSSLHGEGATEQMMEGITRCFEEESMVALLRNGEDLSTAFGSFGVEKSSRQLNYGVQIPILVTYEDLDGRRYKGRMPLKVFARNGFAGAVWSKSKPSSRGTRQA